MSAVPVKLPAIFTKAETLTDNSVKLHFVTRELGGADTAQLFGMKGTATWPVIAPSASEIDKVELPDYKPDSGMVGKTPSQRLRAVLFVLHAQQGGSADQFDTYYVQVMNRLVDGYKAKLDDGERE